MFPHKLHNHRGLSGEKGSDFVIYPEWFSCRASPSHSRDLGWHFLCPEGSRAAPALQLHRPSPSVTSWEQLLHLTVTLPQLSASLHSVAFEWFLIPVRNWELILIIHYYKVDFSASASGSYSTFTWCFLPVCSWVHRRGNASLGWASRSIDLVACLSTAEFSLLGIVMRPPSREHRFI